MKLGLVTIVVREYDEAIAYYCDVLGFEFEEDTELNPNKRWIVIKAPHGGRMLLAKAASTEQIAQIGRAAGGRVAYFLYVDDFEKTYKDWQLRGVNFLEAPRDEPYGKVVQFADLYGNKWDLIETKLC